MSIFLVYKLKACNNDWEANTRAMTADLLGEHGQLITVCHLTFYCRLCSITFNFDEQAWWALLFLMLRSDSIRHILDRRHLTSALLRTLIITLFLFPCFIPFPSISLSPPALPSPLSLSLTNMQWMLFPSRSIEGACSSLQSLPLLYVMYVFTWSSIFLFARNIPLIPATWGAITNRPKIRSCPHKQPVKTNVEDCHRL